MRDIPIIFSTPMVRALLDGRKTMTRRLACRLRDVGDNHTRTPTAWQKVRPSDRLWVREASHIDGRQVTYMADHPGDPSGLGWRPSIHMPRWASRLTLIVTATKIERLQAISPDDAWNEGVERRSKQVRQMWLFGLDAADRQQVYKRACVWEFEELWKSLHGPYAWHDNPEVVALTFTVHKHNIDAMK